jgi:hypothetical protein
MEDSPRTQETGPGVTGEPGVPVGDQYPTNKGEEEEREIVADVHVPGPYPSGRGDPTGEPLSPETTPAETTRTGGSLGDLTKDVSTSSMREETGGLGSPTFDEEKRQDK